MRCDNRYPVTMIKLIPFLNSFKAAKDSSQSIQARSFAVVRNGVALKRKGGIGGKKMVGPIFQNVIIRYPLPWVFNQ